MPRTKPHPNLSAEEFPGIPLERLDDLAIVALGAVVRHLCTADEETGTACTDPLHDEDVRNGRELLDMLGVRAAAPAPPPDPAAEKPAPAPAASRPKPTAPRVRPVDDPALDVGYTDTRMECRMPDALWNDLRDAAKGTPTDRYGIINLLVASWLGRPGITVPAPPRLYPHAGAVDDRRRGRIIRTPAGLLNDLTAAADRIGSNRSAVVRDLASVWLGRSGAKPPLPHDSTHMPARHRNRVRPRRQRGVKGCAALILGLGVSDACIGFQIRVDLWVDLADAASRLDTTRSALLILLIGSWLGHPDAVPPALPRTYADVDGVEKREGGLRLPSALREQFVRAATEADHTPAQILNLLAASWLGRSGTAVPATVCR